VVRCSRRAQECAPDDGLRQRSLRIAVNSTARFLEPSAGSPALFFMSLRSKPPDRLAFSRGLLRFWHAARRASRPRRLVSVIAFMSLRSRPPDRLSLACDVVRFWHAARRASRPRRLGFRKDYRCAPNLRRSVEYGCGT
jgi:hypothetical protein